MEKIDDSQFVRRTKQWTSTVYRVGRTGESPRISTTSKQGYFVHRCYCNGLTYEPASPFSQKSFDKQNIFGSPSNIWCTRCVLHTPKSTK